MIRRIDHVAIAVRSLEEALRFWGETLGLGVRAIETVDSEGVTVALLPVGSSALELLEPRGADSPVGRFLARRGPGLHHLTLELEDFDAGLERWRARGLELVGGGPRTGAAGRRVAFLHPRSTGGVLLEVAETGVREPRARALEPGAAVLAYLRDPPEKIWGVLRRLDPAGVVIEGTDLGSFDDWVAQVERGGDAWAGPSVFFLPMPRLEKLLLDRSTGALPSLAERFWRRTGRTVQEALEREEPSGP